MSVLPISEKQFQPRRSLFQSKKFKIAATTITASVAGSLFLYQSSLPTLAFNTSKAEEVDLCPTIEKLVPASDGQFLDISHFRSDEYKNYSLGVWQDAIRIYTPSFDDLGPVGKDPRWNVFYEFERYLKKAFPKIHKASVLEHANTHGLIYTFQGSDPSLKPLLLTGHQDVVPIPEETIERWTYSPFEAHYDGDFVWGRGSNDCKNHVIALMEAMETLLSKGFEPKRTIVFAFGFDEECGGEHGAIPIGKFLEEKFGEKSFFALVDEGGLGIQDQFQSRFALPGTGEKGYVDIVINLTTKGGHSSVPPKHTGIGIMGHLLTLIEDFEYPLDISSANPFYYYLQCQAKYGKTMDKSLKNDIINIDDPKSKKRALKTLSKNGVTKAVLGTTRAADIIFGGLKINALPEKVTLKINHRIAYGSSLEIVKNKIISLVTELTEIYGLGLIAFGEELSQKTEQGSFSIESVGDLSPAPGTPVIGNPTWDILGGTTRHVFEDFAIYPGEDPKTDPTVIIAPSCMTGNTDTKHYWKLTDNIYRFSPIRANGKFNAHAIDERVQLDAHVETAAWFHEFIRNVDAYEGN